MIVGKNQCQHGQLARVCDRCESAAEIAALKAAIQHYESALAAAWPQGAEEASWEFWNKARIARAALEAK